jgi:hypothetical protein
MILPSNLKPRISHVPRKSLTGLFYIAIPGDANYTPQCHWLLVILLVFVLIGRRLGGRSNHVLTSNPVVLVLDKEIFIS